MPVYVNLFYFVFTCRRLFGGWRGAQNKIHPHMHDLSWEAHIDQLGVERGALPTGHETAMPAPFHEGNSIDCDMMLQTTLGSRAPVKKCHAPAGPSGLCNALSGCEADTSPAKNNKT